MIYRAYPFVIFSVLIFLQNRINSAFIRNLLDDRIEALPTHIEINGFAIVDTAIPNLLMYSDMLLFCVFIQFFSTNVAACSSCCHLLYVLSSFNYSRGRLFSKNRPTFPKKYCCTTLLMTMLTSGNSPSARVTFNETSTSLFFSSSIGF